MARSETIFRWTCLVVALACGSISLMSSGVLIRTLIDGGMGAAQWQFAILPIIVFGLIAVIFNIAACFLFQKSKIRIIPTAMLMALLSFALLLVLTIKKYA